MVVTFYRRHSGFHSPNAFFAPKRSCLFLVRQPLEEFGLQFAVQNGIDDDMADGEVVLHRSGEDIGGFNAGLGREGIHEVRSAI